MGVSRYACGSSYPAQCVEFTSRKSSPAASVIFDKWELIPSAVQSGMRESAVTSSLIDLECIDIIYLQWLVVDSNTLMYVTNCQTTIIVTVKYLFAK